jgi:hypothetical protein
VPPAAATRHGGRVTHGYQGLLGLARSGLPDDN